MLHRVFFTSLFVAMFLAACSSSPVPAPEPVFPESPRVGDVELTTAVTAPLEHQLLDIGITAFTNQYNDSDTAIYGDWVFSEIRDNERHFLPYLLRQTLQESNQWGAIRVLPLNDPSVDLSIEGTIHQSDGTRLVLEIRATDSTGKVWLDDIYVDNSLETDYPDSTRLRSASQLDPEAIKEPFEDIYQQISNDLLAIRNAMTAEQLTNIRRVSNLVYANDLSPESFGHTLAKDEQGLWQVTSLPADDDPMAERVAEMRRRHHLFIDTVDEYYQALYDEMEASYLVWRRYSYDQIEEFDAPEEQTVDQGLFSSTNNTLTIIQRYNRYRWSKIYEQEFLELAAGFNQELAPAILELNKNVHGLSGTMEEQYIQWRRILRQLFALEIGEV
ncbi:MAG: hypothetical protein MI746_08890 [Pseudomonadales bacterium]|nr:hypothetical protein [Pseudomonadales bacterium]